MSRVDVGQVHRALAEQGLARFLGALGVKGRRGGGQIRVACPVHGGKDLNCAVGVKDGAIVFVCHSGCGGQGGDALDFIAAVRGLDVRTDFAEVLREAAQIAGIHLDAVPASGPRMRPQPVEDPAVERARIEAAQGRSRVLSALLELCPLEGEGLRYLTAERGLGLDVLRGSRVGFVRDADRVRRILLNAFPVEVLDELGVVYRGEHFAFERHPLLVPIVRGGRPVYVQGRALGPVAKKHERWRSMRGTVPALWNHDALADRGRTVLVTEGAIDGMTALQWTDGRYAVVGIFGAGGLKPEWCHEMRGRDVVLALDPDDAGDRGAAKATRMLHQVGAEVRRLPLPSGMDLNDFYRAECAA